MQTCLRLCCLPDTYNVYFSETLDAIALKKLVNFVNELMELYFNYVQQRVQLEVNST